MPTEFHRIMKDILFNMQNIFFKDDILIVTKGTKEEREAKVREVFQKLDSRKLQLLEEKCQIAKMKKIGSGTGFRKKG